MNTKWLWLSLCAFLLDGCGGIAIQNTRVCAVAGIMSAGADCAWTLSDDTEEMTLDEFITFLQPNEQRGSAVCQSAEDWNKNKTALEQACKKLGSFCTYEMRKQIKAAARRVNAIANQKR